jgi:hypothetical protein
VPNEQGGADHFDCALLADGSLILVYLAVIPIALLVLPAITSIRLGEYPSNGHRRSPATRPRRWIFLAVKLALLLPVVFCGTLDLAFFLAPGIQPHALLVGYILAFRWALIDQRRRCPVCLRRLTNPTRIGRLSQTFLDWHGTELMCTRGHGLLHVPATRTSCYSTQRWLYLDPSWSSLFPQNTT